MPLVRVIASEKNVPIKVGIKLKAMHLFTRLAALPVTSTFALQQTLFANLKTNVSFVDLGIRYTWAELYQKGNTFQL